MNSSLADEFGALAFSGSEAANAGVSRRHLRTMLANGELQTTRRGLYVVSSQISAAPPDDRKVSAAIAAVRSIKGSVVSHESAGALHGLATGRRKGQPVRNAKHVYLTVSGSHKKEGSIHTISGSRLTERDIEELAGLPVTTIARTAVDIARMQGLPDGIFAMDSALRLLIAKQISESGLSIDLREAVHDTGIVAEAKAQIKAVIETMRGWAGIGFARTCLNFGDPASESALESGSRFNLALLGVPQPLIGWPVYGYSGTLYWADFLWRERMVIGEADGAMKYATSDAARLLAEKEREDDLRARGFEVVRWPWHEGIVRPMLMADKVMRKLNR